MNWIRLFSFWRSLFVSILFVVPAGCSPDISAPAAKPKTAGGAPAMQGERTTKVGQELLSLYNEYTDYKSSGKSGPFKSANPLVRIIDDRVVIDATASKDANVLKDDLVALGMERAVAFGRVVSGELPIRAIPRMSQLESLNFARAASSSLNSPGGTEIPQSPR